MIAPEQLAASFLAGFISFFAPCVVPLFPSYFSVITGFTFADLYGLDFGKIRLRVFVSSLFFIGGFSLVWLYLTDMFVFFRLGFVILAHILVVAIGILTGFEIPLLFEISGKRI